MDQSLEVTNVKTELISSGQLEIPIDIQFNSIKQDCLVQSVCIKTEPQEDDNEFPVKSDTSYGIYTNYDMKIETDEPMIKLECKGLVDELMQDPLNVGNEIKDEEHFPISLDQSESGIKTQPTKGEKDENLLETDKEDTHNSGLNQGQDQLLSRNYSDRKDKKHICHVCNKTITDHLDRHLRVHTGEKPFSCEICKKLFNQKSTLDRHMLIHKREKPHMCDICKKVFRQKSTLNDHKLIHSDKKPFSCNECDKSFTHRSNLIKHKRMHTGDRPYTCDLCNKAFTQKIHLNTHRRLHTGEKPYSCDICNKSFTQKEHLNGHKRVHKK